MQGCGCRSRVMDGSGVRRGRAAQRPRLPPAAALSWGGLCRVTTRSLAGRPGEPALCPGPRGVGGGQQRGPWHRHVHGPPGCSAVQDGRGRGAEAEPAPRPLSWRRRRAGHTRLGASQEPGTEGRSLGAAVGAPAPTAGGRHGGPSRQSQPPSDTNRCPQHRWHPEREAAYRASLVTAPFL
uniref:Uncharacterized protein n=1 Tax=Rousettus aegyptiacus TaxID=9407 RepID=A0A7J8B726_ROUAE|nr:hypothetical protein HJG63_010448 [Rousettus aegyptiacus]